MDLKEIFEGIDNFNIQDVNNYITYLSKESDKIKFTDKQLIGFFKKVTNEGLVLDGKHITINYLGIQYDYIAYKNKMLLVYPETKMDFQVVYKNDIFNVAKESGQVIYSHEMKDPFNTTDIDIIGAYCVIKNSRGEFITTLTRADLDKHRLIAKTQDIWSKFFKEMCFKTVIKKAVKVHFDDIYKSIEETDNENYELNNLVLDENLIKVSDEIKTITNIEDLKMFYTKNKDLINDKATFNKFITEKKLELTKQNENI